MYRRESTWSTLLIVGFALVFSAAISGCGSDGGEAAASVVQGEAAHATQRGEVGQEADDVELPILSAPLGGGEKLRVAATTNILADVVAQVGQDRIELTRLMPTGVDPHSYVATPQDVRQLNEAHVIFLNGLGLEESLMPILENLDRDVPLVVVNAGVELIELSAKDEAHTGGDGREPVDHEGADPHTWFSVPNVQIWVKNIEETLSSLDPSNRDAYAAAAAQYAETLERVDAELRSELDTIPLENRKLVTDHQALGYLADEYGLQIIGAVVPSLSTMAAPSARDFAALHDQIEETGVRAIFIGTTVNPETAGQLALDLGIPVTLLYTGSLSEEDGPAPSYVDLMQYDIGVIVDVLR